MINGRMIVFVLMTSALVLLYSSPAAAGEPCEAWMASLRDYDAAFERVMQGEPQDLLRLVEEARDPDRKAAAKQVAGAKLSGLKDIDPPPELSTLHGHLIAYAQAVVKAVAAAKPTDMGTNGTALRPCYRALLDYYLALRDLMRKHNCQGGDLEALEQNMIPALERVLGSNTTETTDE